MSHTIRRKMKKLELRESKSLLTFYGILALLPGSGIGIKYLTEKTPITSSELYLVLIFLFLMLLLSCYFFYKAYKNKLICTIDSNSLTIHKNGQVVPLSNLRGFRYKKIYSTKASTESLFFVNHEYQDIYKLSLAFLDIDYETFKQKVKGKINEIK